MHVRGGHEESEPDSDSIVYNSRTSGSADTSEECEIGGGVAGTDSAAGVGLGKAIGLGSNDVDGDGERDAVVAVVDIAQRS